MAATVSAWAKPGAWALDSEENEAELLQQKSEDLSSNKVNSIQSNGGDFPSLADAAATKTKKKKAQTLSLQEFVYQKPAANNNNNNNNNRLTAEDLLVLPTGPRQRSAEELDRTRLGGGFRSYGTSSYDRPSRGGGDESRRERGGFNRDSSRDRDIAPSRADEIDNWASAKKPLERNGFDRRERGERGGFFSDSQSRADEVDNWASNKTFVPSEGGRRFGGSINTSGGADASDNWGRKKEEEGRKFGAFDSLRERRSGGGFESSNGGGADAESWGRKREEGGSVGGSGGRPRLNLQPRSLPVGGGGDGPEQNGSGGKAKGSNPFGEARPREEVLKEKGQDWKEIEEKLESAKSKEVGPWTKDGSRRSFGSGNGRRSFNEDKAERTWRKPESANSSRPSSSAGVPEDGPAEDAEEKASEKDSQM